MTTPSKYTMPLNQTDIYQTAIEWRRNQGDNYTAGDYSAPFIAGYNQGVIDALHYVGKQDEICWQNGYDQAKRDMAAEYERGVHNGFASAVNRTAAEGELEFSRGLAQGLWEARKSVIDVMQPEESRLDFFLGTGDKPVCRIVWDDGDPELDRPARWVLSDDQAGTELEHLLVGIGLIERPVVGTTLDISLPPDTDPDFQSTPSVAPGGDCDGYRYMAQDRFFIHKSGDFYAGGYDHICAAMIYRDTDTSWWVKDDGDKYRAQCVDQAYIHEHLEKGNVIEFPTLEDAMYASARIRNGESAVLTVRTDAIDVPEGWIAVPDTVMECPVDPDTKVLVRLFDATFPTHDNYTEAHRWHWNNRPDYYGRITHYKKEPAMEQPYLPRYFKRVGENRFDNPSDIVVLTSDTDANYILPDGSTVSWQGSHSKEDFETLALLGSWVEIEESDLPKAQPFPEKAVAGPEASRNDTMSIVEAERYMHDLEARIKVLEEALRGSRRTMVDVRKELESGPNGLDDASIWLTNRIKKNDLVLPPLPDPELKW